MATVPAIVAPRPAIETEAACSMAERPVREEGILAGISAAIVSVLSDSAEKYLNERFWEEA